MNAEQILIRTLLGGSEYRSVLYDVEPEMLPRGISTPGNIRFTVEKMSMFEEVYDAFAEELRAALARAMEKGERWRACRRRPTRWPASPTRCSTSAGPRCPR